LKMGTLTCTIKSQRQFCEIADAQDDNLYRSDRLGRIFGFTL
jgi:hypothetical protein